MEKFNPPELKRLYKPALESSGEQNGQVTIIGGSELFHGAALFSLKVASRLADMVFFATPASSVAKVAQEMKSKLLSFIWVPWEDVQAYIEKSDAVLIGPGFMRFGSEKTPREKRHPEAHQEGLVSREITKTLLSEFPKKRWVIDAGSLQVMDKEWIPENSILTPNKKEFEMLFGETLRLRSGSNRSSAQDDEADLESLPASSNVKGMAKKYNCVIVLKGPETLVCSPNECVVVSNGNPGMTKGGTGDVLAGLTVALYAKNDAFLSACSASYITKSAADALYQKVGTSYNADDLADQVPETLHRLIM